MRRTLSVVLAVMLMFSVVYSAQTDAVQFVKKGRTLSSSFDKMNTSRVMDVVNKKDVYQPKVLKRSIDRKTSKFFEQTRVKWTKPYNELVNQKFGAGTFDIFINDEDSTDYFAGDIINIKIMNTDTVWIELYVDDGDSTFDPELDFWMGDKEGEEMFIVDNDEQDMNPATGIWEIELNTSVLDGPLFGLQGGIIYLSGRDETGQSGLATGYVQTEVTATSISGSVYYDDYTPGDNMVVLAHIFDMYEPVKGEEDFDPEMFKAWVTMTDTAGNYELFFPDSLAGMNVAVMVFDAFELHPGVFPEADGSFSDDPFWMLPLGGDIMDVNFMLLVPNESISGNVSEFGVKGDVEGILVYAENGPNFLVDTTDVSGNYYFNVNPGGWEVWLDEDFLFGNYFIPYWEWVWVEPEMDAVYNFELYPLEAGADITGNVSDDNTGLGYEGARVIADKWPIGYTYTYTDMSGDYSLPVSVFLDTFLVIEDYGEDIYEWESIGYDVWVDTWELGENIFAKPGGYTEVLSESMGIDFTLLSFNSLLYGTVYNDEDGMPMGWVDIHAYTIPDFIDSTMMPGKGDEMYFDLWTMTDEFGDYELPLMGGQEWIVEVFYPGFWGWPAVMDTLQINSGQELLMDFYISEPVMDGLVEGIVFDFDGNPLFDAHVEIFNYEYYEEEWTDTDGSFSFEELPFGEYEVVVHAPDFPELRQWVYVGPEPVWLEFYPGHSGGAMISGYVYPGITKDGGGIAEALVFAWSPMVGEPFIFMTDSTGYYEFFLPMDDFMILAGANGYYADTLYVFTDADSTHDFYLTPADASNNIMGSVYDNNGNSLKKVFLYWETEDYMGYTFSDIEGNYSIDLIEGDYFIAAFKEGYYDEYREWFVPGDPNGYDINMWSDSYVTGPQITDVMDVPEDQGKQVRVTWEVDDRDVGMIKEFQIWRSIGVEMGWDYITTVPAHGDWNMYNVVVSTLYDGQPTVFMITSIGWDGWSWWDSEPMVGFSEDNLAPMMPAGAMAEVLPEGISLSWAPENIEPVKYYTINKKSATGAFEFLAHSTEEFYVDETGTSAGDYEYEIVATDYAENHSPGAIITASITSIDGVEIPTEFALKQNYPNPFNPTTTISFSIPEAVSATLIIYDALGSTVTTLVNGSLDAGYHNMVWNGMDANSRQMSSGVYFYKLTAGDNVFIKKMILIR